LLFVFFYITKAEHKPEVRPEISKLAIDLNKDNVDVWVEVLHFYVVNFDSYEHAKKIFDDGLQALGNKSLILWEIMDSFLQNIDLELV